MRKLTYEHVKEQVESVTGYHLLNCFYEGCETKLILVCPNLHFCYISWHNFKIGRRCKKCFIIKNKGSNHPKWNPKLTDKERNDKREYQEYKDWRASVYKRDNYTCQICKMKGKVLNAHHLEGYGFNKELRTELNNGITLCEKCHSDFHHSKGYGHNTRKQFEDFIEEKHNVV